MKNVTVSVSDDLYRQARRYAAQHDTSVTAFVRDIIMTCASIESDADRLLREELDIYARLDARYNRHVDEDFAVSARDALHRGGDDEDQAAAA